jgi:predicted  nucleic acid-binding Zn-ribbon protein
LFNQLRMSSLPTIEDLNKENQELRKEIAELNYLLELKEEELNDAKTAVENINLLKSKLEDQLYAFEQMQLHLEDQQRKTQGLSKREAALEEEVISSISMEKSYYELLNELSSMKAALADANDKLEEIPLLYKEHSKLKSRIAALESDLGFALSRNSLFNT